MGYLKAFFTTLFITLPSYLFIQIYLDGVSTTYYFTNLASGNWIELMQVFETAIMEPINVFFIPADAIRIVLAFLPWVVSAFVCSFFYRKKHSARGGLISIVTIYTSIGLYYYFMEEGGTFDASLLTEANLLYGYLVVIVTTTIIGVLSGLISPFKKEHVAKSAQVPRGQLVTSEAGNNDYRAPPSSPSQIPEPYYMPTESPSRSAYMEQTQTTTATSNGSEPLICEYCGSYIDADSEFCSVCGNRVVSDN
ncbi:MAG: hypothetical protein ACTSXO_10525 [Candidatus Heimdallarchaeota archaeon]